MRIVIATVALLVLTSAGALAQGWREYRPSGGGYRVEMPGSPKKSDTQQKTDMGTVTIHQALYDGGKVAFAVAYTDYPQELIATRTPEQLLAASLEGLVRDGKVRNQVGERIAGQVARRVTVDRSDGFVLVNRVFYIANRQYQMTYVGPQGTDGSSDVKRFFSSFALVVE